MKKRKKGYYQYRAMCHIMKDFGKEEDVIHCLDTDIPYNGLHIWNRKRLIRKCEDQLVAKFCEERVIRSVEFHDPQFVLIPEDEEKKGTE